LNENCDNYEVNPKITDVFRFSRPIAHDYEQLLHDELRKQYEYAFEGKTEWYYIDDIKSFYKLINSMYECAKEFEDEDDFEITWEKRY
jgi:hypothetical protein